MFYLHRKEFKDSCDCGSEDKTITKDGRPLWCSVGLSTLYVQGSEWPSTSRVILCQWHSTILITN